MAGKKQTEEHPPCTTVQLVGQSLATLIDQFNEHQKKQNTNLERIWGKLDKVANRPPIWASVLITILASAAVGLVVAIVK